MVATSIAPVITQGDRLDALRRNRAEPINPSSYVMSAFMKSVRAHYQGANSGLHAERLEGYLKALKATGLNEAIDPDGGVLVPTQASEDIWRHAVTDGAGLLPRLRKRTVDTVVYQQSAWAESSRATGTRNGGIRAYLVEEGEAYTGSTGKLAAVNSRLHKLTISVALTDELLQDSPNIAGGLEDLVAEEFNHAITGYVINGLGVAEPLGLVSSGSRIAIAKESGQAAGTVVSENIRGMLARFYCRCRPNGCWLVNPLLETQLATLDQPSTDTTASRLVQYIEPSSRPGGPFALIAGMPAYLTEQCQAPGTEGDLILVDPSSIQLVTRTVVPEAATSMHLKFSTHEHVFRWTVRFDSSSLWPAPITPQYGSSTVSNIITIAVRA